MRYPEYTNCYCFNPACVESIFNARTFSGIKMPLSQVLQEEVCCTACGEELISKPLLEVKLLVYDSLQTKTAAITI